MGYVLYGAHGSGSALVEAALTEIGVEYEFNRIDAKNAVHRKPEYAAVNPHRKMPTLVTPNGGTLTESAAIVLTLDERHRDAALLPPPASPERAVTLRWMIFVVAELYPLVEFLDYPERLSVVEEAKSAVRDRVVALWRDRWLRVEEALDDGPYLLGEKFCTTDIFFTHLSRWDLTDDYRAKKIPKIERLARTVLDRSKLRDVWRRNSPCWVK